MTASKRARAGLCRGDKLSPNSAPEADWSGRVGEGVSEHWMGSPEAPGLLLVPKTVPVLREGDCAHTRNH